MKTYKWVPLGMFAVLAACMVGLAGCAAGGGGGGGGGDQTPADDQGQQGELDANFDEAAGGNFAVAQDQAGNQYTFRSRDENGQEIITEANVRFGDGTTVKASLDATGRPVKLRSSAGEDADIVYTGDAARVRYTGTAGTVEDVSGIDTTTAKAGVRARRALFEEKRRVAMAAGDEPVQARTLREGLARFEEIVAALLDSDTNPFDGTSLADAVELIALIGSTLDIREVGRDALSDVDLDETPPEIGDLAGQTFILFDAEGLCVNEVGLENRLTFDNDGVLLTEFDLNVVFPDFSLGGANQGVTINYASGTPVDLASGQELDFAATVTPIFTGTQLDGAGHVTIERRFLAEITYLVQMFTTTEALTEQLFNAALINGVMDGDILSFDLILVDLAAETPVTDPIRLRYYRQGSGVPEEHLFPCEVNTGDDGVAGIDCPPDAQPYHAFDVGFTSRDRGNFDYDWFVSSGYGYVENPFEPITTVVPTGAGLLEITLIVSDLTADPEVFEIYTCEVRVGDVGGGEGFLNCPQELLVGEPGFFFLEEVSMGFPPVDEGGGGDVRQTGDGASGDSGEPDVPDGGFDTHGDVFFEWFVFGTSDFEIFTPFEPQTEIIFWAPGRFEVGLVAYGPDGGEEYFFCEVEVNSDHDVDFCELYGYYGDGVCDSDCPRPDPDCERGDWCADLGWYDDDFCDEDCPQPDPACEDEIDFCAEAGLYGDGTCDDYCPEFDPDCEGADECEQLGLYGDGFCDEFCPLPDPDCEDICAELGWYGDGVCDDCPRPDPDCGDTIECFEDFDCPPGTSCVDGLCLGVGDQCHSDADCPPEELCVDGECIFVNDFIPCDFDTDCPPEEICVAGFCEFAGDFIECLDDLDCDPGQECFEGLCVFVGDLIECLDDLDCDPGQECLGGFCAFVDGI